VFRVTHVVRPCRNISYDLAFYSYLRIREPLPRSVYVYFGQTTRATWFRFQFHTPLRAIARTSFAIPGHFETNKIWRLNERWRNCLHIYIQQRRNTCIQNGGSYRTVPPNVWPEIRRACFVIVYQNGKRRAVGIPWRVNIYKSENDERRRRTALITVG